VQNIIGIIPARYGPMVVRVYRQAKLAGIFSKLLVATDDSRIVNVCEQFQVPVVMTPSCSSGTERVYQVVSQMDYEVVVNIQGDEPFLVPQMLQELVAPLLDKTETSAVSSLYYLVKDEVAFHNRNRVKVVVDPNQQALYFSRSPIPYQDNFSEFKKHLGFYGYTKSALEQFIKAEPGELELSENLEQLRFFELGIPILMAETKFNSPAIDSPEDLE